MTIQIPTDVVHRNLSGEAVILNLKTGTYFGLNEIGTRIWNLLEKQTDPERIVGTLVSEYAVEQDQAHRDVVDLIKQLTEKGLLESKAS